MEFVVPKPRKKKPKKNKQLKQQEIDIHAYLDEIVAQNQADIERCENEKDDELTLIGSAT